MGCYTIVTTQSWSMTLYHSNITSRPGGSSATMKQPYQLAWLGSPELIWWWETEIHLIIIQMLLVAQRLVVWERERGLAGQDQIRSLTNVGCLALNCSESVRKSWKCWKWTWQSHSCWDYDFHLNWNQLWWQGDTVTASQAAQNINGKYKTECVVGSQLSSQT